MATKLFHLLRRDYVYIILHGSLKVCTRGWHRTAVLLVFLLVALVTVWCLPFSLHRRTTHIDMSPVSKHLATDSESEIKKQEEIEALLNWKISNYSKFTYEFSLAFQSVVNKIETADKSLNPWCASETVSKSKLFPPPSVTLIFTLYNIVSEAEAVTFIRQNMELLLSNLTDDVIMTAENRLSRAVKNKMEEVIDTCSVCRLFFLQGNIYSHRNEASRFARHHSLVFVDARVRLTENWLQPLIGVLQNEKNVIVSPQMKLSYTDGSGQQEGLSRNEVTWDLGATKVAVSDAELETSSTLEYGYVSQTVISKEVFGVHKEFFTDIGGFDLIPGATGGEHVSFSLKVLNCKGNIVTSLCSHVFLSILDTADRYGPDTRNYSTGYTEFWSTSFNVNLNNVTAYYVAASVAWLDAFTTSYYSCAISTRVKEWTFLDAGCSDIVNKFNRTATSNVRSTGVFRCLKSRYISYGDSLKKHLMRSMCDVGNLKYIISQRQPTTIKPTKSATYYGYIRSVDGMYAFGMSPHSSSLPQLRELQGRVPLGQLLKVSTWTNFLLTRNTSLWFGPFSFTNGAFIYKNVWCLTVSHHLELILTKCVKGLVSQLFTYQDQMIRPIALTDRCACAMKSVNVSSVLLITSCYEPEEIKHFQLDVQFTEKCIQ